MGGSAEQCPKGGRQPIEPIWRISNGLELLEFSKGDHLGCRHEDAEALPTSRNRGAVGLQIRRGDHGDLAVRAIGRGRATLRREGRGVLTEFSRECGGLAVKKVEQGATAGVADIDSFPVAKLNPTKSCAASWARTGALSKGAHSTGLYTRRKFSPQEAL